MTAEGVTLTEHKPQAEPPKVGDLIPVLGQVEFLNTPAGLRPYRVTLSRPMRVIFEPVSGAKAEELRAAVEELRAKRAVAEAEAVEQGRRLAMDLAELEQRRRWRWWRPSTWRA